MTGRNDAHLPIIEHALDAIEDGVRRPLDVDQLAHDCGMSYWHFQRVFAALTGEPVGGYIRRRRLSAAARELRRSPRRILDIALDHQFVSHAAFTRAFRTMFAVTPARFRRDSTTLWAARPRLTGKRLRHLRSLDLQPEIVELPPLHLLGLSTHFLGIASEQANHSVVLPRLWQAFRQRAREIKRRADGFSYGAWDCLPPEERSDPDELKYLAGLAVTPPVAAPRGMVSWSAPALRYARFLHRGPIQSIGETISCIYAVWLPRSGCERANSFDLERYDHRRSVTRAPAAMEYFVPLAG